MKERINIICGATASGKSQYALDLALKLDGEIINADASQVYKEIPIITAQPAFEELQTCPHHLYGIINCNEHNSFSVAKWLNLVVPAIKNVLNKNKTPIIVGGTGMYIKSLIEGISDIPNISAATKDSVDDLYNKHGLDGLYQHLIKIDPITAKRLQPNDFQRIYRAITVFEETKKTLSQWHQEKKISFFSPGCFYKTMINMDRELLYDRCNKRFDQMLETGALEEAKNVANSTFPKAIGLGYLVDYALDKTNLEYAVEKGKQETRNYAKRQITWFKNQMEYDFIKEN